MRDVDARRGQPVDDEVVEEVGTDARDEAGRGAGEPGRDDLVAPLPPSTRVKSSPWIVSPRAGRRCEKVVRSAVTLPTTTTPVRVDPSAMRAPIVFDLCLSLSLH